MLLFLSKDITDLVYYIIWLQIQKWNHLIIQISIYLKINGRGMKEIF